jgi:exopolyphosphatase/pppGpp-phosphohydrolase
MTGLVKTLMVKAVRDHALANYEKDGWDYVVEAWDDEMVLEAIEGCKTVSGAIRKVAKIVKEQEDYRQDIQSSAF